MPIQCTPTMKDILFNPNFDTSPVGTVHAKYRINSGAWVNYEVSAEEVGNSLIGDFFNSIKINGKDAIEIYGNSGNANSEFDLASCTPFRSYQGRRAIHGAADKDPFENGERVLIEPRYTTIEFEVTQNNINDLVYLAFGESCIVTSCAVVGWEGL